ncbi:MAG TPA: IS256 family transposase [Capsulimonadaceae bacterium]|jgi:transposase-like protein
MNEVTLSADECLGVEFSQLEDFVRQHAQTMIQRILEEEVKELLGRGKSERLGEDSSPGYRNGYGKERRLSTSVGTVTVRRPRVRDMQERFVSRVLPLFTRRTNEVGEVLPKLYLHGLALGDFELALRGLLGEGAPLSPSSIARSRSVWLAEHATWRQRPLDAAEVVYLWVDGIYVKAGLEKDKAALLVVIAGLADGRKEVIAVEAGHRESEVAWSSLLRDLKKRGMVCPRMVVGDGALGIWAALNNVYPQAGQQRCWNHRLRNVLDCVGKKKQPEAKELLTKVMYAETEKKAVECKRVFQQWAREQQYDKAAEQIDQDWERMVAYYSLPKEHWLHLRTSNIIESPFASIRLRTTAAKRFKKVEGATAMIWKLLMVAEQTFRKLNAPELLASVYEGHTFKDGVQISSGEQHVPRDYKMAV